MLHVCFIHKSRSERSTDPDPKSVAQESGSPKLRVCRSMMQEPMMGHLTLLGSPVPSAVGSPERRGSTGPKPRVCRSIMQEPMMEHLNRLGSPFPPASGSPEYRRSTDPDPKSVIYSDTILEAFRSVLRPPERISELCWNVLDASWKIGQRVSMSRISFGGRAMKRFALPKSIFVIYGFLVRGGIPLVSF